MRFLEIMLLGLIFVYVAQLFITLLFVATCLLFVVFLIKRPREALILGLAVLAVAFISTPIGMAVVAAIVLGIIAWVLVIRFQRRRPMLRLTYRPDD